MAVSEARRASHSMCGLDRGPINSSTTEGTLLPFTVHRALRTNETDTKTIYGKSLTQWDVSGAPEQKIEIAIQHTLAELNSTNGRITIENCVTE